MTQLEILKLQKKVAKKMLAAIAMLLVATTMLVGVSYAWVSISSAPEASKISTTVGANGALEIALQSTTMTSTGTNIKAPVSSGRGLSFSSTNSKVESNKSWGNVVDLSDDYGLENILFTPARLNLLINGSNVTVNPLNPLVVPNFGVDGRIASLSEVPKTHYDTESELYEDTTNWGVNVIGFKQELNDLESQTIVRSVSRDSIRAEAAENIYQYRESIRSNLIGALELESDDIFGVINKTTLILWMPSMYSWDENDAECVRNIASMLAQAASDSDAALRWAFLAFCVSDNAHFDAENEEQMALLGRIYKQFQSMPLVPSATDTSDFNIRTMAESNGYTTLVTAIDAINQVKQRVAAANTYLNDGEVGNAGACIISVTGSYIMNGGATPQPVYVLNSNGRINTAASRGYFYNLRTGRTEDTFFFVGSNSVVTDGLFQAMARVVGDYTAELSSTFKFSNLIANTEKTYNYSLKVTSKNTSSLSQYNETANTGTLGQIYNAVAELQTTGSVPLEINRYGVNAYGFGIDLAFRTNQAGSLILEKNGKDRITGETVSSSDDESETQGKGSTISFVKPFNMSAEQATELVKCLYAVFMTSDGQIYAVGVPDSIVVKNNDVTGVIQLYNVDIMSTVNNKLLTLGSSVSNNLITNMLPDREVDITVVIYLDGDRVSNEFTYGTTGIAMSGSINLQFGNSIALKPADLYKEN